MKIYHFFGLGVGCVHADFLGKVETTDPEYELGEILDNSRWTQVRDGQWFDVSKYRMIWYIDDI